MKKNLIVILVGLITGLLICSFSGTQKSTTEKWTKYSNNPVLGGGELGTVFDICVLKDRGFYKMYCSWRPQKSIALSTSKDGKNWSKPKIVLSPTQANYWENEVNRPIVVCKDGLYHMWYTGQSNGKSWIGYALSKDGYNFVRQSNNPVLSAEEPWEKVAVMCPHVIWDKHEKLFKMWYSGGEQYEPDAIGYATSKDGLHWTKLKSNPIFKADSTKSWEQYKVTACQVIERENDYLMFYIGFRDIDFAQIGMARSKDGIGGWERYPGNPIISPTPDTWDASATYKPFAIQEKDHWMLWYNGRNEHLEQIGLVIYNGHALNF
ncbi:glycoside hydrolase family protein [Parabacteroides pacaensis]|uniref:hypothetical protein n=1 Tax=Parabacteroides pacaensis TaxID=2086575 RepID=UPI000D0F42E1|nr:hypothetical protein [Parabacteroides pacaensis]